MAILKCGLANSITMFVNHRGYSIRNSITMFVNHWGDIVFASRENSQMPDPLIPNHQHCSPAVFFYCSPAVFFYFFIVHQQCFLNFFVVHQQCSPITPRIHHHQYYLCLIQLPQIFSLAEDTYYN